MNLPPGRAQNFLARRGTLSRIAGRDDSKLSGSSRYDFSSIMHRTGSDYLAIAICGPAVRHYARSARMHRAILPVPIRTLGGSSSTQRACAKLQRGAKEQLVGALSSEGGVPGIVSSLWPRLAPCTVDASNPFA
jgi:hypothetical protein